MKIKSICYEKVENIKVYNFHCSPDENYFANKMLVHNCYKANTSNGKNMSYETFEKIFHQLPATLTQIAFGADASLTANPDLWKMMELCRKNKVVPNITCADISKDTAILLSKYVGAVAVSYYGDDYIFRNSLYNLKKAFKKHKIYVSKEKK